jgi:signal transduction histidine kinase
VHLLSNAAEALAHGNVAAQQGIRVAAWRTPEGRTIVEISDTGRGIPPKDLSQVFDASFTTKHEANRGHGLSHSQQLLARWDGTISIHSSDQTGTSFRVDLPSYLPPSPVD